MLNLVAEFHRTFKHPILSAPGIPSEDRCKLRVALIAEELKELEVAILEKDIVEIADALSDIQYVLSGAILEFGLGDKFKDLFEEVQRSNMSKACTDRKRKRKLRLSITIKRTARNVITKRNLGNGLSTGSRTIKLLSLLITHLQTWKELFVDSKFSC
jgi:predicted HAD superfamily Cof-like phosphohydrolase